MSIVETPKPVAEASPRHWAALVGFYYLLTILTGVFVLFFHGKGAFTADIIASGIYIAMTALLYELSKPVNRRKGL